MSFLETSSLKNSTIMLLSFEREKIDLNPAYQRSGGIWTLEKKQLLIDSIINDYDIPKIYFHKLSTPGGKPQKFDYAVIDGRQRLETIWGFMDGEFNLSDDFEYQKDQSINLGGLSYADLAISHPKIRVNFDSFVLPVVSVETSDMDLIEDMFSRLNEAVPLNAAEKRNAIGGDLVEAIRQISEHDLFKKKVGFSGKRAQYKEVSARFLLVENAISVTKKLIDTKKVYLDDLAKRYKKGKKRDVNILKSSVLTVLDKMTATFTNKDPILRAQGTMTVYYMLFRGAEKNDELGKITREKLISFRESISENRVLAQDNFAAADFDLLEFDRLNQQGTNDAWSIRERYRILANFLGLTSIVRPRKPAGSGDVDETS